MNELFKFFSSMGEELAGWLPVLIPYVPQEALEACAHLQGYVSGAGLYSELVPWGHLGVALVILVAGIAAAITMRALRIGVSVVSGGGGA